ncbi:MAG: type I-A CRISPR-associated protein Cas4/Csa1 [Candidatus Bathyarchaeia archaeon]
MFYTIEDSIRLSRAFRQMPCEVSEEVRGWNWNTYPLAPPSQLKLSVSDIFNGFCDSWRILYLRYVVRERLDEHDIPLPVVEGSFIHRVFTEAVRYGKALLYRDGNLDAHCFMEQFKQVCRNKFNELHSDFKTIPIERAERIFFKVWSLAAHTYSASLDRFKLRSPYLVHDGLASTVIPLTTESPIDGSLIGLNRNIRPDAVLWPATLIELKTRQQHPDDALALTAYAIAFESEYETPQNFGVILYVRFDDDGGDFKAYERIIQFSDKLRTTFIERRDRALTVLEEGIEPEKPSECSPHCPYLKVCRRYDG